jgi:hypothetical protein
VEWKGKIVGPLTEIQGDGPDVHYDVDGNAALFYLLKFKSMLAHWL